MKPRWPPVPESARSWRSYDKIGECEQSSSALFPHASLRSLTTALLLLLHISLIEFLLQWKYGWDEIAETKPTRLIGRVFFFWLFSSYSFTQLKSTISRELTNLIIKGYTILLNERNRLTLIRIINHVDLIQKLADQDLDLRQKAEDSKERERNLEQQLSAESAANQELQVRSLILLKLL